MGCFKFSDEEDRSGPKAVKLVSNLSSSSALGDDDITRSGSDFNSQDISDTSAESMRKNSFFSMSQRSTSNLRVFTFQELKSASKGFSRSGRIGEGGFGCVYRGVIKSSEEPSTKIDVAIKQLGKRGLQGHKEWVTEVNFLGVVEHPNLVKLLGYCADDDERGIQRLLIYEYMPNGSVEDHLSSKSRTILPWAMRLRIARDAARGLAYLHEEMDFQIIFRDFKSSNILLDEQWNAKLSDFGLARLGPPEGLTHVSTAIVGTMGYAAPEYIRTGRLTSKNDVWSYGVFLYELITGRRPIDKNRPKCEQRLIEWVRPFLSDLKKTVKECESKGIQGEQKYCATSLEGMVDYAKSTLGKNVKAISTEARERDNNGQMYTIGAVRGVATDGNVAVCHKQNYAYAVFYCHKTKGTSPYVVTLISEDGVKSKAVAICHKNTSGWNPKHLAFQVLNVKPGSVPICHFLPEDHIVWVRN